MSQSATDEYNVAESNLGRIAAILAQAVSPEAQILSEMLTECAEAHAPSARGDGCRAFCTNEEWPCPEWQRAEHYAVDWLITAYEKRT